MAGQTNVLCPINFTPQDQKALGFIQRFMGDTDGFRLILFHAYAPIPESMLQDNPVMAKMQGNISYLNQVMRERRDALEGIREELVGQGMDGNRIHIEYRPRRKDIAADIVDVAMEKNAEMVVINRKPGKVSRFFTGSVFSKVVSSLRDVTVCIVS